MFKNKIIDSLFSYKGGITSRYYRAMLLLILLCFMLSLFPILQYYIFESVGWSTLKGSFNFRSPFFYFYQFVILYGTFAVTIKRARAKQWHPAWGWVSGLIIFLMFWSISSILPTFYGPYYMLSDIFSQTLIFAIPIVCFVLGVITIISLSVRCRYDNENETDDYYTFNAATYLFKVFNLGIILAVARLLLGFVQFRGSIAAFIAVIVLLTYLGFLLSYLYCRAADAAISQWWVTGFLLGFIVLEFLYLLTGNEFIFFLLQAVLFARLILISLPSVDRGF